MSSSKAQPAKVTHKETTRRGVFHLGEHAEMTYTRPGAGVMKVNHTLVDEAFRGEGRAHRLYRAMVDFARQHERKVIAVCPFVTAMFEEHPEDRDVLAP